MTEQKSKGLWSGISVVLASGFGLGYSPVASGTVGSLLGVIIAYFLSPLSVAVQVAVCVVLVAISIPICHAAEAVYGKKDDGRIVADEYLIFPICMIGLPFTPWMVLVAFLVCRVLDIVKPPPASQSQCIRGGVGIVVDDVISTLYALGVNWALFWGWSRFFGGSV